MQGFSAATVPPERTPETVVGAVEALARALGCTAGGWTIEFRLVEGRLRQTRVHRGPIGNAELEQLARELREQARKAAR